MEYLGPIFNTRRGQISLPYHKVAELVAGVNSMMGYLLLLAKYCMTLLGMFTEATPAVPWAKVHTRAFQISFLNQ